MRPVVEAAFPGYTKRFEGLTTWMYLDIKGLVTIGMGNLIEGPDEKPNIPSVLVWRDLAGTPALHRDIANEWHVIKSLQRMKELGGGVFRSECNLRVTQESVEALVTNTLLSFERDVKGYFPTWDVLPAGVQLVVMSLAWACGPHFPLHWPKFTEAVNSNDWSGALSECRINELGNPGVVPRNKANEYLLTGVASGKFWDSL